MYSQDSFVAGGDHPQLIVAAQLGEILGKAEMMTAQQGLGFQPRRHNYISPKVPDSFYFPITSQIDVATACVSASATSCMLLDDIPSHSGSWSS